jgi:iron complex outermembrane receptor protein
MFYGLTNLGAMKTEGWDLGIRYRLPEYAFGRFTLDLQNSYVSKYDEEKQNSAGDTIMDGRIGRPGVFRLRSISASTGSWATSRPSTRCATTPG